MNCRVWDLLWAFAFQVLRPDHLSILKVERHGPKTVLWPNLHAHDQSWLETLNWVRGRHLGLIFSVPDRTPYLPSWDASKLLGELSLSGMNCQLPHCKSVLSRPSPAMNTHHCFISPLGVTHIPSSGVTLEQDAGWLRLEEGRWRYQLHIIAYLEKKLGLSGSQLTITGG